MPYKDPAAARLANRERQRRHRERQRAKKAKAAVLALPGATTGDPVGELAAWAASALRVPPGHPLAGRPMALPPFAEDFLRAGWGAHESALCIARKNAKSAICAVLALGFLVGPLRTAGWRGAIASVSKEKAGELRGQVAAIVEASGLEDEVTIRKSPYPGVIASESGTLETLASERTAGHSSSFDLVIVDETGLFPERSRELLAGLRSSVSAKGGRVIHISVRGDSPLFGEVLDNPATVSRVYAAAEGCAIDDRTAWAAANPGLGTIKQAGYMAQEVTRIRGAPADEPSFRAFDLNQNLDPTREMILSPDDLRGCYVPPDDLPAREGRCFLGFDFGEATSSTAACAIWPATGRVETWQAFGNTPPLIERQRRDSAPYVEMQRRGELRTYPGRIVRPEAFLGDLADALAGCRVEAAAADSYKDSEVRDFLDRAALRWPVDFRRVGAGKDGGRDVRAFQRLVHQRKLAMVENLSLATAISKSTLRRDANGNPGLDRASSRGRIDVLSAAVIAAGLAEPAFDRPARRRVRHALAG